jgi:hypothetical protein
MAVEVSDDAVEVSDDVVEVGDDVVAVSRYCRPSACSR